MSDQHQQGPGDELVTTVPDDEIQEPSRWNVALKEILGGSIMLSVFSVLLALIIGGFLIAVGLLTRPVALANAVMLAVTIWFHVTRPYGDAFLTPDGIEFLKSNLQYLTDQGQMRLLNDGGAAFLHQVQAKAEFNSTFWTAGAALIAAFGGGKLSLDRRIGREF